MKNVMVILCDQLRYDFLSCYGSTEINTPNIDKLAQDGVLFQHATTASPVCAPGRASMMTGRYVSDHNVWTNDVPFRENMEFLPQRMKDNGYVCGAFGKLHHYPKKDSKGFDVALQMEERRLGDDDDYYQYLKALHPEICDLYGMDSTGHFAFSLSEYYEEWIANNTMKFIAENADRPFFTWVSFQGPHGPIDAPHNNGISEKITISDPVNTAFVPPCEVPRYRKSRGDSDDMNSQRSYREGYAELVQLIDYEVGRLIDFLKEHGKYDDTVIIFSADHGDLCGDYNMRQKGPFPYRAQLEIPMIVTNHSQLPKNEKSDMLVSNLDIAGTVLDVACDTKPLGYSRSIAAMYNDKSLQRDVIFSEFCDSMKLVTTKTHKMAYYPFTGQCELIEHDNETINLAELPEYQVMKAQLLMHIIDFMVIARGIHIEAQDLTPMVQAGLSEKLPNYKDDLPLVFPIPAERQRDNLRRDGLDANYNEFCKDREIINCYGAYWDPKKGISV